MLDVRAGKDWTTLRAKEPSDAAVDQQQTHPISAQGRKKYVVHDTIDNADCALAGSIATPGLRYPKPQRSGAKGSQFCPI